MDISNLFGHSAISESNPATESEGTALIFRPIELQDVKPGMTLRFKPVPKGSNLREATIVSTVRIEIFHPVDEELVADAVYPNARLSVLYHSGDYEISALEFAF